MHDVMPIYNNRTAFYSYAAVVQIESESAET